MEYIGETQDQIPCMANYMFMEDAWSKFLFFFKGGRKQWLSSVKAFDSHPRDKLAAI